MPLDTVTMLLHHLLDNANVQITCTNHVALCHRKVPLQTNYSCVGQCSTVIH